VEDSDSSPDPTINLEPSLLACVTPAPETIHKCKEYARRPAVRTAETPSIIWYLEEEYKRNKHKFWRCGICKKNEILAMDKGTSSARMLEEWVGPRPN
jgi:hypothetical protein